MWVSEWDHLIQSNCNSEFQSISQQSPQVQQISNSLVYNFPGNGNMNPSTLPNSDINECLNAPHDSKSFLGNNNFNFDFESFNYDDDAFFTEIVSSEQNGALINQENVLGKRKTGNEPSHPSKYSKTDSNAL